MINSTYSLHCPLKDPLFFNNKESDLSDQEQRHFNTKRWHGPLWSTSSDVIKAKQAYFLVESKRYRSLTNVITFY